MRSQYEEEACVYCGCTDGRACQVDGIGHWISKDPPVCSAPACARNSSKRIPRRWKVKKLLKLSNQLPFAGRGNPDLSHRRQARGAGRATLPRASSSKLHAAGIPFVLIQPTVVGLESFARWGPGLAGVYVFGGRKADLRSTRRRAPKWPARSASTSSPLCCRSSTPPGFSAFDVHGRLCPNAVSEMERWTATRRTRGGHELAPQSSMNAREGEQEMLVRSSDSGNSDARLESAEARHATSRISQQGHHNPKSEICAVAHRTIGPQDVKAIGEWVKYHGEQLSILADLPTLPSGEAVRVGPGISGGRADRTPPH